MVHERKLIGTKNNHGKLEPRTIMANSLYYMFQNLDGERGCVQVYKITCVGREVGGWEGGKKREEERKGGGREGGKEE